MKARKARRPLELLLTLVVILSVFFYRSPAALAVDIDAAYPAANITGYILSTSNKTAVAYASIGGPSVGHIYANDDCTIQAVYTNGWVKVSVPWSGYPNGRVVYTERSNFINSVAYTPWPLKAPVKTAAYSRLDLSQRLGYVYAGDNCYVVNEVGDYYQILCPWTGGVYRLCWANKIDFGGGPAPASAECTGYVSTSSLPLTLRQSASTNAKILANMPKGSSVTVLDNKAVTNGFYHVKYGSLTGYASTTYISFTASAPSPAPSSLDAKINSFLNDARFCNGNGWGYYQKPLISNHISIGCCAYTADFIKYVYNVNHIQDGSQYYRASEIRKGDVIYCTPTHWMVITGRSGNTIQVAEGNWNSKVHTGSYTLNGNQICASGRVYKTFQYGYHY